MVQFSLSYLYRKQASPNCEKSIVQLPKLKETKLVQQMSGLVWVTIWVTSSWGFIKVKLAGKTLNLSTLAVMPECRKRGVARSLILEAERMFSNVGLLSVWCVEQTGNVQIFEALGFKVVERVESDIFELTGSSNAKAIEVRLERKAAV
ncbi:GNAT family N-acetyltransferase [Vibrio diabolicus]|uniref:GNAT family N-acetyltransferase n=1 Tax=Vibrio diabolicus TaxID=50719 RepID=UPI003750CD1F